MNGREGRYGNSFVAAGRNGTSTSRKSGGLLRSFGNAIERFTRDKPTTAPVAGATLSLERRRTTDSSGETTDARRQNLSKRPPTVSDPAFSSKQPRDTQRLDQPNRHSWLRSHSAEIQGDRFVQRKGTTESEDVLKEQETREQEVSELKKRSSDKEEEIRTLKERYESRHQRIKCLEEQKSELSVQAKTFEVDHLAELEQNKLLQKENEQLKHQLATTSLVASESTDYQDCSVEDERCRCIHLSVIASLRAQLKELNEDIVRVREHTKEQSRQILVYRQLAEISEEIEGQLKSMEGKNQELEEEQEKLQEKLREARTESHRLQSERKLLDNELETAKKETLRFSVEKDDLKVKYGTVVAENTLLLKNIEKMSELSLQVVEANKRIKELDQQLALDQVQMKQYQDDFRQEREDRETAHGLMADMEKECTKGGETSNYQQLSDRLREAEEANKRLLEDLETVRREVSAFQQEIIEKEMIHAQLRKELEHSQAEKIRIEERLIDKDHQIKELETKFEAANSEVKTHFTRLHSLPSDNSWNFQRKEVVIKEEIGRGASGLVSKGQFRGQTVAVKQIHQNILTQKHVMDEFKREVKIMAGIQHPNLVRFIGAVFDQNVENFTDTPLLLLELLHTNLRQGYERSNISLGVSVSIFRDVAYGLHYLHEHQEPIIHRDVSAPNVLLEALPGGMWRAKLSDFGSANFLKRSLTLGTGAIVYTAPEMFPREDPSAPVPRPTTKCDVFSYGVVLVEVITKTMPSLENRHELFAQVQSKWKMMYDMISQCTQRHPQNRPTMLAVLNTLNKIPVARPR